MLEKYTYIGKFKLSSGGYSNTFYDIQEMIATELLNIYIPKGYDTYVGIATGGAILAAHAIHSGHPYSNLVIFNKEGELKGKLAGRILLIDDVVTTESAMRRALKAIGEKFDVSFFTVVDRRKKEFMSLNINSLYRVVETEMKRDTRDKNRDEER